MSRVPEPLAQFAFEADVIHWRGPSPYFFAALPILEAEAVRRLARSATYGWGMIPVEGAIKGVHFTTSLFARDGTYLMPLKDAVRRAADVTAGDRVEVEMTVLSGS